MWKELPLCGLYEVSDDGKVRNHKTKRELAQHLSRKGYLRVNLWIDNRNQVIEVHRLMLITYIGPADGQITRHLDGSRTNNTLGNLCYGTIQENADDRVFHGNSPRGEKGGNAKLTQVQVDEIRQRYKRFSHRRSNVKQLAAEFGINRNHILRIINRVQWRDLA